MARRERRSKIEAAVKSALADHCEKVLGAGQARLRAAKEEVLGDDQDPIAQGRVEPDGATRARVVWEDPKAGWREKGHIDAQGQWVAPRPFARPLALKLMDEGREAVAQAVRSALDP